MRKININKIIDITRIDLILLFIVIILAFIGLIMIYSASSYKAETQFGNSHYYLWRHLIRVLLGMVALVVFFKIDYHRLINVAPFLLFFSMALLIFILFKTPMVPEVNGARRWIQLSGLQFQPSELGRYALILFMARTLGQSPGRLKSLKGIFPHAIFILGFCSLVYFEPDLGSAIIILLIGGLMLFFAGANIKHMAVLGLSAISIILFLLFKFSYQSNRLQEYLHNLLENSSLGWQVRQSLISLAQGGISGVGFGNSRQKYGFLPESFKDFIFSIIGEEAGFVGAVLIVSLFLVLVVRGMHIAMTARDDYGRLLAAGITISIGIYGFFNIGVSVALLPTTGIPMPFVSYGGTALITNMAAIGILLNICYQGICSRQNEANWPKFYGRIKRPIKM